MKLQTFTVLPKMPEKLEPLLEIASNLWYSWNWDAIQIFKQLDPEAWKTAHKNPLRMLGDIPQQKLEEIAEDEDYIARLDAVYASFKKYLSSKTWFEDEYGERKKSVIAYFSCEFGLHESLPIYSGGLGVLAGDHVKSASDLGIPLVAIGLLYRQGYFWQGLDIEGNQIEFYPENDWFNMPVELQKDGQGSPLLLSMNIGKDKVFYQVWKVQVGRIPLYLLDANLEINPPQHRDITKRLYDSDRTMRLKQELLLGMGGIQTLRVLGHNPEVFHINEGHSAFLILERIRVLMEEHSLTFDQAKEIIWTSSVFTIHTPVPAGNERFDNQLVKKYLEKYVEQHLKLPWKSFLALGQVDPKDETEEFCMSTLALKFSIFSNGVAKLHGKVSRNMWKNLYPKLPTEEVPIGHITNGVHTMSWLSKALERLLSRHMETTYVREIADFTLWKVIDKVPHQALWDVHHERKVALIEYARDKLRSQLRRQGANASEINKVKQMLNPDALTIGFARRFAPYKRGTLLFQEVVRLEKLVSDPDKPVQFIFAGKAHPADTAGKTIIKDLIAKSKQPEFVQNIIFLENYDLDMARYLVQGVDVWLNTPRRPQEASGTSGMKAAMNGAINLSVLDGWWDEAFDETNGWAIGHGETYEDKEYQDSIEAKVLYRLIENEVVPLYYDRNEADLPEGWIKMMKDSIRNCGQKFNAHRMVHDYVKKYYLKAEKLHHQLIKSEYSEAKNLALLHSRLYAHWEQIQIVEVSSPPKEIAYSDSEISITAKIHLGEIRPEEITVEIYHGALSAEDVIENPQRVIMKDYAVENSLTLYKSTISCYRGGRYGYTVRIIPGSNNLSLSFIPGLVKWS